MNHPFTITREPWHKHHEGAMEYRGLDIRFDTYHPCEWCFAFNWPRDGGQPAPASVEALLSESLLENIPANTVEDALAALRDRIDRWMSQLAVLLDRAGEPRANAAGEFCIIDVEVSHAGA